MSKLKSISEKKLPRDRLFVLLLTVPLCFLSDLLQRRHNTFQVTAISSKKSEQQTFINKRKIKCRFGNGP